MKFGTGEHCYMLITILMFIFPKFLSPMLFGQIWPQKKLGFLQIDCNIIEGYIVICLLQFQWFFSEFFSFICFGQIWSQNLKFYKLTKIWYRGFFQNFCHSYFWGKFGPKVWNSPYLAKFDTGVYCYMLITILIFFFFQRLCHSCFLGKFGPISWFLQIGWNFVE